MAVLNFPDPAAQTPADTFSPTSTPAATSNGVTYVWTDGSWSIASTSNGELLTKDEADSYYVEQSGDNMTGPLTLGGDKITLGVDGSASFAGNVNISDFDGGSGLILAANGTVNSSGNGLFGKRVQGYEQVEGGNNINASYGAVLYSNNATASQATIYARNYDNSGTGNLILCEGPTGGNAFTVNTSGSATFGGQITAGDSSGATAGTNIGALGYCSISHNNRVSQNCLSIYDGQVSNSTVFSVTGAGTATFAGNVDVASNGLLNSGCYLSKSGILQVRNDTPAVTASINVLKGGNSAGDAAIAMFNDGSASFERNIVSKGPASGGRPASVTVLNNTTGRFSEFSNSYILQCSQTDNPDVGCYLGANGNWRFSGTGNTRGLVFDLEPDNDANYTTTTDTEGNETRVYNGPTLDVKAVIQDLQQRVNDRDSVIANLTTRIQALEGGNN